MGASEGLGGPNKADPHVPPAQGDNIHQEWGFVAQGLRGIGRQQGETKKCDSHVVWEWTEGFLPLCVGTRRRGGGGMWRAIWKEGVKGSERLPQRITHWEAEGTTAEGRKYRPRAIIGIANITMPYIMVRRCARNT
jgi:hypothetical protein